MSAKVSDYKDVLYTRDYSNDAPPQTNIVKRVALAAVPFLSLHVALRYPVSIAMGTLRVVNTDTKDIFGSSVAIIALAASIFQHQIGMAITTAHDTYIEIQKLRIADNWEDAAKSLTKIISNLVYLALISYGGLELSIIAFALQAAVNLIQAKDEFKSDRWIEGVANLFMAGIRLKQCHTQYQQLKRNWEIEAAIKRFYVGLPHEKWQFPSDHLPVGVEVNGVKIISWNVLNNAYMKWVHDDSQGLKGSLISELNVVVDQNGLTMRDVVVADMVQNMMSQGHVVALQECSEPFLQHLQSRLPSNWDIIKSFNTVKTDQDVILFNKSELACKSTETAVGAFQQSQKAILNANFTTQNGENIRVINAHLPGDPALPGKEDYSKYVYSQHKQGATTVALGDYNFERAEMIEAYRKAGFKDFSLHTPWKTNIDPYTKESKGIDHLFVIGEAYSRDLKPQEVVSIGNLQETVDLLNQKA